MNSSKSSLKFKKKRLTTNTYQGRPYNGADSVSAHSPRSSSPEKKAFSCYRLVQIQANHTTETKAYIWISKQTSRNILRQPCATAFNCVISPQMYPLLFEYLHASSKCFLCNSTKIVAISFISYRIKCRGRFCGLVHANIRMKEHRLFW
jgi:hypothetical protein